MRYYVYLIAFIISIVLAVVGGIAFRFLEVEHEARYAEIASKQLQKFLADKQCMEQGDMAYLETLLIDMKKGGIRINKNESTKLLENITNWDMQSTIFLALQVMGSVGYGNAPPLTTGGRVFCVLYGLFGLPLFIIAAYGIGDQLFHGFDRLRVYIHKRILKRPAPPCRESSALVVTLVMIALIGVVFFVIIPAAIFYSLEDWTYGEALYCCLITVLTIGYADFVPGEDSSASVRTWYRLAVGGWIMLALLWFGGVLSAIRKLVKYEEIHRPFRMNDDDDDKNRLTKKWKKHFDRQWRKLRGQRCSHPCVYNQPIRASSAAFDARQRASQLDSTPNYTCSNCLDDAPAYVYDATGKHVRPATSMSAVGINVSKVHVTN